MSLLIRSLLTTTALMALASGCGGDETQATEDHTPVSYSLTVNDVAVTPPYTFVDDATVRVRITFFNAAQENLDDIASSHFAGLVFDPVSLATAVGVPDQNYQFDVTGVTPGSGTLVVSFGHDESADEVVLPPAEVRVSPSGGGGPP